MKVTIDNPIKFYNSPNYFQTLEEFGDIVQVAASSKDEDELKDRLSDRKYPNFIFGFGSSHFWASQRVKRGEELLRNVFVEFDKK